MATLRVLAAATVLLLPLSACAGGSRELVATPAPISPPPATMVHIDDVRVGMCLDAERLPDDGRVAYLEVLDCSVAHTGEVHLVRDEAASPAGEVPDSAPCQQEYRAYVGSDPDTTRNEIRGLTATEEARAGQPAPLVCVTVTPGPTTGSVRGTGT